MGVNKENVSPTAELDKFRRITQATGKVMAILDTLPVEERVQILDDLADRYEEVLKQAKPGLVEEDT